MHHVSSILSEPIREDYCMHTKAERHHTIVQSINLYRVNKQRYIRYTTKYPFVFSNLKRFKSQRGNIKYSFLAIKLYKNIFNP